MHTPECEAVQVQAQDAAGALDAAVPWDGYNQRLFKAWQPVKRALWKREITKDCASCIEAPFVHNVPVDEQETCGSLCPCDLTRLDKDHYNHTSTVCEEFYDELYQGYYLLHGIALTDNSGNARARAGWDYGNIQVMCHIQDDDGEPVDAEYYSDSVSFEDARACMIAISKFAEELGITCPPVPDFEHPGGP